MPLCGFLRLGTAVDVLFGPCIDDTTGKDAETGLTLDVEISVNGQGLANKSDATAPVHDGGGTVDGYYNCELDETDTGTLGIITLVAHAAGFLPVRQDYQIIPAIIYDSLFATAATDYLPVDVVQVGGVAQSATDLKDFADTGYDPSTHKVQGVVLVDTTTTNTDMVTEPPTVAQIQAEMEENGASLLDSIDDRLPADPADESLVEAAITAAHATTNGKIDAVDDFVDTEVASILAAVDTEVGAIKGVADKLDTALELDGAVYRFTENALEEAPAGGGGGGDATLANQTRIIQILTGKWEVKDNQLKMYDSDGTTVLYTFNLTQDGVPTEFNPDLRSLV